MARTINKDIDIFTSFAKGKKAFDNSEVPCQLLYSEKYNAWYLDRAKEALKAWPEHYELLEEK